jgi:signal transduction histidine kinase/CheY-like chemotaxis protein/HPt (histidine-containing phosphotransfer) domain-containing protein
MSRSEISIANGPMTRAPPGGLLQRIVWQVRHDIQEFRSTSRGRADETPAFQAYAVAKSLLVARLLALLGVTNLIFWAPTDLWVYRGTGLLRYLVAFRVLTLANLTASFLIFSTVSPSRQTAWRIVLWYWIVIGTIFGVFGYASTPAVPLLYTSLMIPTATAAFLVPLRMRVVMNLGGVAVFIGSYFGPHPDYWSYQFGDMLLVDLLFACATSLLLGHFIYRLERTSFAQRVAIEQHASELEELDRAKDTFVATISHELRTPLNSIMGLTDVMLDDKLAPETKGYVRTIRKSGEVLQRLINDVLDLAKIRAGKLEMEMHPLALQDVVENCVSLFMVATEEKSITLAYDVPSDIPELLGDEGRISQILLNLLSNAVKFTPSGEIVVVASWQAGAADQPPVITIKVADTGPGIPLHKRDLIFEEFTQVDASTSRRYGGTGLGLPIVRRLARLMGGEVTLDANVPQGCVFTVTLPMAVAPGTQEHSWALPTHITDRAPTVVVCAAHPLTRRRLVDSVARMGLPVEGADTDDVAATIVTRLRQEGRLVGGILLKQASMSAARFARSPLLPLAAGVPIIVIASSRAAADDSAALRNLGAQLILHRPVRRVELRDALVSVLGGEPSTINRYLSVPPRPRTASTRILAIDDVADNRALLQAFVKDRPVQIEAAAAGEEGLALFRANRYDAVFLDIQMPEMDGYAVIDRMRAFEREKDRSPTPIIALTAHVTAEHQLRIRQHGFTQHMTKPIRKREFLEVIGNLAPMEFPQASDSAVAISPDLSELLPAYFHNRREDTIALMRYVGEGNFHEIGRIGHKIQGSGGSYGFPDISAIGTRMEEAANRGDANAVKATITELENSIARHYGNA